MKIDFATNHNVQAAIAILVLSFSLSLLIVGALVRRFRFFDDKRRKRGVSREVGKILCITGCILGFVAALMLLLVLVEG